MHFKVIFQIYYFPLLYKSAEQGFYFIIGLFFILLFWFLHLFCQKPNLYIH